MTERESFIRAICENPADDTVRLVFADWLDEHGEGERAEFIRWQVGTGATMRRGAPGGWVIGLRAPNTLWCSSGEVSLFPSDTGVVVSRGFVSEVKLPSAAFLDRAGAVFAAHPVTRVVLTDKQTDYRQFWDASIGEPPQDENLPRKLINVMAKLYPQCDHPGDVHRWLEFRNNTDALEALSEAAVAYGRELAGLPPLAVPAGSA